MRHLAYFLCAVCFLVCGLMSLVAVAFFGDPDSGSTLNQLAMIAVMGTFSLCSASCGIAVAMRRGSRTMLVHAAATASAAACVALVMAVAIEQRALRPSLGPAVLWTVFAMIVLVPAYLVVRADRAGSPNP